jgi:carbon-monoxide dehydrogenase large subunit
MSAVVTGSPGNTRGLGGAARFVGASVPRREDRRLLTGRGQFVDDVQLPGMLHVAFVRSPLARARIRSVGVAAAQELGGVVAVFTGQDGFPQLPPWWPSEAKVPAPGPLAVDDVRFVGDPVVIVVAESRYVAEDACELVDVEYEPLPPVVDYETAGRAGAELGHPELGTNVASTTASPPDPALDAAMSAADHVFKETIRSHRHAAVPMETRGIVASWSPASEELTVWMSGQAPHVARGYFSAALGLPEHAVRVIQKDVGGGFGQKAFQGRDELCVLMVAQRLGRPLKWIEDRQENLMAATHARQEQVTVELGVSDDGLIQGLRIEHLLDAGAYPAQPADGTPGLVIAWFTGPYKIPHYGFSTTQVYTNTCALGPYRGPWVIETTARETMLDIAARGVGIDPVELRRRNTIQAADLPHQLPTGIVFENISPAETLEQAVELSGYEAFREEQRRASADGRLLGIEAATIRIEPSGKVTVLMGLGSHGHSVETTMAQVVADALGVPFEDVILIQGDTASAPVGAGNLGSRSAVVGGAVAGICAQKVLGKVLDIAAHLMEAAPEDLELVAGMVAVKGSPSSRISLADVASVAYDAADRLPEGMEPGIEETTRYSAPFATHSNATHVCTCEVDRETGLVTLLGYTVSEDCGVMINPMVVEGQIAGGVVQGIGGVLLEHIPYDRDGNPLAVTFKDYLLPVAQLVPEIRIGHIETRSGTPGGHKGAGEGGTIGAVAAVVNAVADALAPLGVIVTTQPLSPSSVLSMIEESAR